MSRNRCRIYRSNSTASPASVLLGSQPSHTSARRSLQIRAFHLRWDGPGGCRGVGVGVGVGAGVGGGGWGGWDGGGGAWRRGMGGAAWPGVAGLTYLQTHVLFANFLQTICKPICKPICKLHFKETHNCALSGSRKRQNVLSLLCSPAHVGNLFKMEFANIGLQIGLQIVCK